MGEIKITEENKEIYEKFYLISIFAIERYKCDKDFFISTLFMCIRTIFPFIIIFSFIPVPTTTVTGIVGVLFTGIYAHLVPELIQKKERKNFKKMHPDFDTNVDLNEIDKSLKEYQNLKKKENLLNTPIVDTKKLNSNTKLEKINVFETMTPEEKIVYLEREREFWMMEVEKQKEETVSQKHL